MHAYLIGTDVRSDTEFRDDAGVLTDPTTVIATVRSPSGVETTPVVAHDGVGLYHAIVPADEEGAWWVQWLGTGALEAAVEEDFYIFASHVSAPTAPLVGAGPMLGPCRAWITAGDVAACLGVDDVNPALLDTTAVEASMTLFELSGRRFSGVCEETIRPCSPYSTCWLGMVGGNPGWHWGSTYAGVWGWWSNDDAWPSNLCGCQAIPEVALTYPVGEVSEVKIGGDVLDPSAYRVDEYRKLVRIDGAWWPTCQNLLLADTEEGTFSVTYTHGVAPPPLGQAAAVQLAAEFYRGCSGGECALPVGTTKLTRQGVTVERGLLASWFSRSSQGSGWVTGLSIVDSFLTTYNPSALRRAPSVWSPDLTMEPRRVGT